MDTMIYLTCTISFSGNSSSKERVEMRAQLEDYYSNPGKKQQIGG